MVNTGQNECILQQRGGEEVAAHAESGFPFPFAQYENRDTATCRPLIRFPTLFVHLYLPCIFKKVSYTFSY